MPNKKQRQKCHIFKRSWVNFYKDVEWPFSTASKKENDSLQYFFAYR